jgi:branched-chain amino acid aminotransferase
LLQPDSASALDGITRRTVFTLAAEAGLIVRSKRITRDEVFLTGTAAEITPVIEVDARRIGNGVLGPVTQKLQAAYFASVCGEAENHCD